MQAAFVFVRQARLTLARVQVVSQQSQVEPSMQGNRNHRRLGLWGKEEHGKTWRGVVRVFARGLVGVRPAR